jgi:hypothetical protein
MLYMLCLLGALYEFCVVSLGFICCSKFFFVPHSIFGVNLLCTRHTPTEGKWPMDFATRIYTSYKAKPHYKVI